MSGAKFGADTFGVTSNLNMKNINWTCWISTK